MIRIRSLSKQFRLYSRPSDRVWEWLGRGPRHRAFWALRDVTLDIPKGRTVGIVGPNGAGKSTLLKLVTGTLVPTSGTLEVAGRVAALLELGTGFHPEFTGRQNIWINGQLLGLDPEEIARRESEIIGFSELGPFIDQPIRTYSSGMVVRLGFSVAASVDPDVLIVDEALSVGDAHFSQKCIRRIRHFRDKGTTILFVSHDPGAVLSLCDEAVLLDAGEVQARGRPEAILEEYTALLARRGENNVEMTVKFVDPKEQGERPALRAGSFRALVSGVRWLTPSGLPTKNLVSGERATLEIEVFFVTPVSDPTVGFLVRDRLGQDVFGTNTRRMGERLGDFDAGERLRLRLPMDMNLGAGDYSLTTAVHQDETHLEECHDWMDRHHLFHVVADRRNEFYGVARLRPVLETTRDRAAASEVAKALGLVFGELPRSYRAGEPHAPSPFLQGFHGFEPGTEGEGFRWTGEEAYFVASLQGRRIALEAAAWGRTPGDDGTTLTLELGGGRSLGERGVPAGERARVQWDLPPEAKDEGRVGLFRLQATPGFDESSGGQPPGRRPGRRLGVAVLGVSVE